MNGPYLYKTLMAVSCVLLSIVWGMIAAYLGGEWDIILSVSLLVLVSCLWVAFGDDYE